MYFRSLLKVNPQKHSVIGQDRGISFKKFIRGILQMEAITSVRIMRGGANVVLKEALGPLLKLDIWHDNQGDSPSWYLKTICVKDLNMGANYTFNCYNWLSAERGDGQIERELTIAENTASFKKRQKHVTSYLPWAINCGFKAKFLMNVYFEKRWEEHLEKSRKELNIPPLPA